MEDNRGTTSVTAPATAPTSMTAPPAPRVTKITAAVFGASITVASDVDGVERTFKKKELISALQKGVRRQDFELAAQAVCCLWALAEGMAGKPQLRQALLTNMVNRIVMISREDCAETRESFEQAYWLWERRGELGRDDVLRVVYYLCTHGTSRLGSHMRAYHEVRSGDLVRELEALVKQSLAPSLHEIGRVSSLVGSLEDANPVYEAVLRLAGPFAETVRHLVHFTKKTRGGRMVSKKTGKRDKDHDFLVRECVVSLLRWRACPSVRAELEPYADLSRVDFGAALPHYVYDQHCMRAMKGNAWYFASCASVTAGVIGGDGAYQQAAYRAYMASKGVAPQVADALVAYAAGETESPPEVHHPVLGRALKRMRSGSAEASRQSQRPKVTDERPALHRVASVAPDAARPVLGMWELVADGDGRYCCGMKNGRKAPVVRGRTSMQDREPQVIIKLFKSKAEAEYAKWAYGVLASFELPVPEWREVVTCKVTAETLAEIADCEAQVLTWSKWYVGDEVPCLVASAVGERAEDFRRLCDDDVRDETLLRELVKVLIVRCGVIRSSDCVTSNLRVRGGHVYSIDHNVSTAPEFVGRKFSRAIREAVLAEMRSGRYERFLKECQDRYPEQWAQGAVRE